MRKTHSCGELTKDNEGQDVRLIGWARRIRDHGGKKFIDLRDREGLTQVIFDPDQVEDFSSSSEIGKEYLIAVEGKVEPRPEGNKNSDLGTGEIEVQVTEYELISTSKRLPFPLDEEKYKHVNEDLRLQYRYLDMRRRGLLESIKKRHDFRKACRDYLEDNKFIEVETPYLTKSTPEGARDFIVPARKFPGKYYALPQSPQLFKQLLMVGGIERYYQFVKCFRDEDTRKDRQPEFTQLDIELSFTSQEELLELMEEMFASAAQEAFDVELETPFNCMTHQEAMENYGTDRPDLRFGLELRDVSELAEDCGFDTFSREVQQGGAVKGITLPSCAHFSRSEIEELEGLAKEEGAKGLVWIKKKEGELQSPIAKFVSDQFLQEVAEAMGAKTGDLMLLLADERQKVNEVLGQLRLDLADKLELIDEEDFAVTWVLDFPLFDWSQREGRFKSEHHPFTKPKGGEETLKDLPDMSREELENLPADAYDLVLNGFEVGGGSGRIHLPQLQRKVFDVLELGEGEVEERFGWFLEALNYSPPPHRGIAFGLDRIIMIFRNQDSIRDVIPFPKNKSGYSPLTESPALPRPEQLAEIKFEPEEEQE